jgi:hypothetical protein
MITWTVPRTRVGPLGEIIDVTPKRDLQVNARLPAMIVVSGRL